VTGRKSRRVAPFGHLGINACVPLPQAYRSLPRPSSPPCAQASPTCLHSLDYNNLFTKQSAYKLSRPPTGLSAVRAHLHSAQCAVPFIIECQSDHPSLDEMPPFNKDSQIRDLPLLPLSKSIELVLNSKSIFSTATPNRCRDTTQFDSCHFTPPQNDIALTPRDQRRSG
jgi:hypothetical protein